MATRNKPVAKDLSAQIHDLLFGQVESDTSLDNDFLRDFVEIMSGEASPANEAIQGWINAQTDTARADAIKKLSVRYSLYRVSESTDDTTFILQTKEGKDAVHPARGDKLSKEAIEWYKSLRAYGVFNTRFHRTISAARWLVREGEARGGISKVYQVDKNGVINVLGALVMSESELENAPLMGESPIPLNGLAGRSVKALNERAEKELNVVKKSRTTKRDTSPVVTPKDALDTLNRAFVSNDKELVEATDTSVKNGIYLLLSRVCEVTGVLNHGIDNEDVIDLGALMAALTIAAKIKLGFAPDTQLKPEERSKMPKFKSA